MTEHAVAVVMDGYKLWRWTCSCGQAGPRRPKIGQARIGASMHQRRASEIEAAERLRGVMLDAIARVKNEVKP